MELLIFSDSHGDHFKMAEIIRRHKEVSTVLFLGDGLADAERLFALFPRHTFRCVRGNMDYFVMREAEETEYFSLYGCGVFMLHGHTRGVKGGTGAAERDALRAGARVLLYGHTHELVCRYLSDDQLYVFNPGSIGRPYHGNPTYGLMDSLPCILHVRQMIS